MRNKQLRSELPNPYYIVSPDYTDSSSGIIAMHLLCHALNLSGKEAYVTRYIFDWQQPVSVIRNSVKNSPEIGVNKHLRTPVLKIDDIERHKLIGKNPIAIYPEIIQGNPLNLSCVSRYILNVPGLLGGDTVFDENELKFYYRDEFAELNIKFNRLYLPTCDLSLFNLDNTSDLDRNGVYFYINRYRGEVPLQEITKGATEISFRYKRTLQELSEIFKTAEMLYSYEPSALCGEALLCGCPVVYLPNKLLTEIPSVEDFGNTGIAWGALPEQIEHAKATVKNFYPMYLEMEEAFWQELDSFINITQEKSLEVPIVRPEKGIEHLSSAEYRIAGKWSVNYSRWYKKRTSLNNQVEFWQSQISKYKATPSFHFLITLNQGEEGLLANTIDSLSAQIYINWHLTVVSVHPSPDSVFEEFDSLTWLELGVNDNPYQVINEYVTINYCEWFCLLEPGGIFDSQSLALMAHDINLNEEWSFIYIDEDKIDKDEVRSDPLFKPDFNLDLLRSTPYMGDFCFIKLKTLLNIGGFPEFPGAENYDIAFRVLELLGEKAFGHIAEMVAHKPDEAVRNFDDVSGLQALSAHLHRQKIDAIVENSEIKNCFHVTYKVQGSPKISIIISTRDQKAVLKACIDSIVEKTSYSNYEIIIIDNQSNDDEIVQYLGELALFDSNKLKIIKYDKPFNFAAINNLAVEQARGEYVVLLNNDTMVLQEEWLQGMLCQVQRDEIGAVGVKLVYPNKTVQHAGIILGMAGVAGYPHVGIPMGSAGYMNRAAVSQNVSAVSAACMMVSKKLYQELGGLDANNFGVLFGDVDFCLKVQKFGKKIVWTPYVTLIHYGAESLRQVAKNKAWDKQAEKEVESMLEKWMPELSNDQAYNRNLSLKSSDFQVDTSIGLTWKEGVKSKPKVYAFPLDSSGVGQYRVRGPVGALTRNGVIESSFANNWDTITFPKPVEMERIAPDVLLIQNGFLDHMLTPWRQYRKFNNTFMVAGLDDLVYMLPSQHPKQGVWPSNIRRKVKELFQLSDRVVVANDALKEEFSKMTGNIIVVPNYLENWRWDSLNRPEKPKGKRLRVGWAGGSEHISDLEFILPVVKSLHEEVDWVFMGLCLEELKPFVKEAYVGVDFNAYPQQLANLNLDLAIAPLMHNKFNECKTNLRLLEYGVMGWPVVCTDILPYQNAPVTRVANNVNEWVRVIREKINEPDELLREGVVLRQWVVDNYMLDDHIDEWTAALLPN